MYYLVLRHKGFVKKNNGSTSWLDEHFCIGAFDQFIEELKWADIAKAVALLTYVTTTADKAKYVDNDMACIVFNRVKNTIYKRNSGTLRNPLKA